MAYDSRPLESLPARAASGGRWLRWPHPRRHSLTFHSTFPYTRKMVAYRFCLTFSIRSPAFRTWNCLLFCCFSSSGFGRFPRPRGFCFSSVATQKPESEKTNIGSSSASVLTISNQTSKSKFPRKSRGIPLICVPLPRGLCGKTIMFFLFRKRALHGKNKTMIELGKDTM